MDTGTLLRRIIRSRWTALLVGLVVLLAWALFLGAQLVELRAYPWQPHWPLLLTAIAAAALYFGGLALGWALLLRNIGGSETQHIVLADAMRIWLFSMMTRYIPGNVWHILSRVALAGQLQVVRTRVLTSATIEQVLTILGALALAAICLPFWGVANMPGLQLWLLLLLPAGLVLLHPAILGRLLRRAAARLKRPELAWEYKYVTLLRLLAVFIAANFLAGLALFALIGGLTTVTATQVPLIIGAASLAWVAGYLSFLTPSGLGVREAFLTAVLVLVFPLPVAILASLLHRIAMTLGEFLAVCIAWLYRRLHRNAAADKNSLGVS